MDPLPDEITIGESYGPCTRIETQEEADAYFERLVERNMRTSDHSRKQAEEIERGNIGYFSGYYDPKTMVRVQELFRCAHPIFGKATSRGVPTPAVAFEAGEKLAREDGAT